MLRYRKARYVSHETTRTDYQLSVFRTFGPGEQLFQSSAYGIVKRNDGECALRLYEPTNSLHGGVTFDTYDTSISPADNLDTILEETSLVDSVSPALLDPEFLSHVIPRTVIYSNGTTEEVHLVRCYSINEEYSHNSTHDLISTVLGYVLPHINLAKRCDHSFYPLNQKDLDDKEIWLAGLYHNFFTVNQKRLPHGMQSHHMCNMRLACKELYHLMIDYFEQFVLFGTAEIKPNMHVRDVFSSKFPYRGVLCEDSAPFKTYKKLAGRCRKCGGQYSYTKGTFAMQRGWSCYHVRCRNVYVKQIFK